MSFGRSLAREVLGLSLLTRKAVKKQGVSAFIAIDKALGPTSRQVTDVVKTLLNVKCGHHGTLDPEASGIIVLALGNATKFLRFLPNAKSYAASGMLGVATRTDDAQGPPPGVRDL